MHLFFFLCNKPLCRNRACTNFYMAANVHRADRRDDVIARRVGVGLLDYARRVKVRAAQDLDDRLQSQNVPLALLVIFVV